MTKPDDSRIKDCDKQYTKALCAWLLILIVMYIFAAMFASMIYEDIVANYESRASFFLGLSNNADKALWPDGAKTGKIIKSFLKPQEEKNIQLRLEKLAIVIEEGHLNSSYTDKKKFVELLNLKQDLKSMNRLNNLFRITASFPYLQKLMKSPKELRHIKMVIQKDPSATKLWKNYKPNKWTLIPLKTYLLFFWIISAFVAISHSLFYAFRKTKTILPLDAWFVWTGCDGMEECIFAGICIAIFLPVMASWILLMTIRKVFTFLAQSRKWRKENKKAQEALRRPAEMSDLYD